MHEHFKQAIVAAEATGTWVLNKRSTPCIRALKTQRTQAIFEAGLMPADTFAGIQKVYFDGEMEAAPALAGQSAGLIHEVLTVQHRRDGGRVPCHHGAFVGVGGGAGVWVIHRVCSHELRHWAPNLNLLASRYSSSNSIPTQRRPRRSATETQLVIRHRASST